MTIALKRNKEDVEQAFFHLMYQFRQMNQKYGLMVTEEINNLYQERNTIMEHSKLRMEQLENKL